MRGAWFWVGFVALLPQALWVRKTTPRFSKASGEPRGLVVGSPDDPHKAPIQLVGLGDSIIAGVGAPTHAQALIAQVAHALSQRLSRSVAWQADGKIGADAVAIADRASGVLAKRCPDVVIISTGVNDLLGLVKIRDWRSRLEALIAVVQDAAPEAMIVLSELPPMGCFPSLPRPLRWLLGARARHLNEVLMETAASLERVEMVSIDADVAPEAFSGDGFHPGVVGYRQFGEKMALQVAAGLEAQHNADGASAD